VCPHIERDAIDAETGIRSSRLLDCALGFVDSAGRGQGQAECDTRRGVARNALDDVVLEKFDGLVVALFEAKYDPPRKGTARPGRGLVVRMPSIGGAENGAYFDYPPSKSIPQRH
jgi:hypothetical protein